MALATSAAPTFFPPHCIGDRIYLDGGLIANSPDIVALQRVDAQANASRTQAASFLGPGFYRIDKPPERPIALDEMRSHQLRLLTSLANEAVAEFRADVASWRRFF